MSEQTYQPTANRMLREGCTQGMLFQYLEKQGLRDHEIAQIIRAAVKANSLRQRVLGFAIMIGGLAIVSACFAWISFWTNADQRPPRLAFVIAMLGLIIALAGLVRMVSTGGRA